MKASQFFIATLKEAPADAEIASHKLMMRAGMIKRLGAGIYNYMPMGLRVIRKVEAIIREEMNRAGAVELLMPVVQPAELWQETGRFEKMGPELLRVKDRHERDFIIQPTSEEVVTDIARQELRSYRQLPKNFYHIQTKFRDERRPRFGVMRGREFTMKDAYSFDRDEAGATKSYQGMFEAYKRIFDRFGLQYRAVAADTGAIGGDLSHEFQVIADTGEDAIVYCPTSDYAANIELAEALPLLAARAPAAQALAKTPTPGKSTCEDVAALLGIPLQRTVKSLVLATDELDEAGGIKKSTVWLLLVRGDHALNEVKAGKVEGLKGGFRFATGRRDRRSLRLQARLPGPDRHGEEAAQGGGRPHGGEHVGFHLRRQRGRLPLHRRQLGPRPARARCGGRHPQRGGGRSVARWQGRARDPARHRGRPCVLPWHQVQQGDERHLPGRDRQAATDADGLLRHRRDAHPGRGDRAGPRRARHCLARRDRAVHRGGCARSAMDRSADVKRGGRRSCTTTSPPAGIDVMLDDRGERPGAMFADWELIGVPHRVVISDRGLKDGKVEVPGPARSRRPARCPLGDVAAFVKAQAFRHE